MTVDPIEVVGEWLQNLLDPGVVNRLVASEATYVSLNTEDAELSKIMPWAGTSRGPQAFLDNLGNMFARWENQAFNVNEIFASGENVAVFGSFRYRSKSLDKVVNSPLSIHAKAADRGPRPRDRRWCADRRQRTRQPAPAGRRYRCNCARGDRRNHHRRPQPAGRPDRQGCVAAVAEIEPVACANRPSSVAFWT